MVVGKKKLCCHNIFSDFAHILPGKNRFIDFNTGVIEDKGPDLISRHSLEVIRRAEWSTVNEDGTGTAARIEGRDVALAPSWITWGAARVEVEGRMASVAEGRVLVEVPVMLSVVWIVNRSKPWYEAPLQVGISRSQPH